MAQAAGPPRRHRPGGRHGPQAAGPGLQRGAEPALRPADRLALRRVARRDGPRLGARRARGAADRGRSAGAARHAAAGAPRGRPRHAGGRTPSPGPSARRRGPAPGLARAQPGRGARGPAPVASATTATYAYDQVARVPSELRDQRDFVRAAADGPGARHAPADLLTGLRGKDVLLVFVESYGRVALDDPGLAPGSSTCSTPAPASSSATASTQPSGWLTSPTFGALSWLAHSTLQSGLWVDSQQRYDHLVTTDRETLSSLFARAGWRTVAAVPANTATGRRARSTASTRSTTRARSATADLASATRRCPTSSPSTPSSGSSSHPTTGRR